MFKRSLALSLLPLAFACSTSNEGDGTKVVQSSKQRETPIVSTADVNASATSTRHFGVDLYNQLAPSKQNLFFSPHSIASALTMTYAGARTTTASEMHDTLQLSLSDDAVHAAANSLDLALTSRGQNKTGQDGQPFRLKIANAVWAQDGYAFLPGFLDVLAVNYGAGVNLLDFVTNPDGARTTINAWVEKKTEDKIKDLLQPGTIKTDTRLVLTNAIYFNAAWADKFDAAQTANAPFTTKAGATVSVATMNHLFENTKVYQSSNLTAVAIPYDGEELSMVVIRPDNLTAFEDGFDGATLDTILDGLQPQATVLHLPKWKVTDESALKEPLMALGMPTAFSAGADFSGIDGTRNLVIDDVIHKAFVSVDEKGTEAAAATAVIIGETSAPQTIDVKIDRAFLYVIRDNATGAVVFFGRVVDPTL